MIIVVATKCYLKDEYRNLFENFRNEGLFFSLTVVIMSAIVGV